MNKNQSGGLFVIGLILLIVPIVLWNIGGFMDLSESLKMRWAFVLSAILGIGCIIGAIIGLANKKRR